MCYWLRVSPNKIGGVPNSGWITFRIRSEQDIAHALWLMRLSYLRYALKEATDPGSLFEHESGNLCLSPRFKSLLEPFVLKNTKAVWAEPFPAQDGNMPRARMIAFTPLIPVEQF